MGTFVYAMKKESIHKRGETLMLLTNGFQPDPRVHKEAVTLIEIGFGVTIICLDRDGTLPPREVVDGIDVRRIRVGDVKPGEVLSVGTSLARFYAKAAWEIGTLHKQKSFKLIHCNDFDTVGLGLALKFRYRIPVVYDMHDQYSSFLTNPVAREAVQRVDAVFCRAVDAIIVVNEEFLSVPFIDERKSTIVMNVPTIEGSGRSDVTDVGIFYAGNLDRSRDMHYAMDTLAKSGFPVQFAGDGPLLNEARTMATSEKITFLGRIPVSEVHRRTLDCLAVLALYDPAYPNNRFASPNKLFDAMKYGKPAIVSNGTVMAGIVEKFDCGLVVEYGSTASLKDALNALCDEELYERLSINAYEAFSSKFNWEIMEPRLFSLYRKLTDQSSDWVGGTERTDT